MSSSTPSPASDDTSSEGEALRAFVDEAIAKDRQAEAAGAFSPRSAILSHSSLRSGMKSKSGHGPHHHHYPDSGAVDKRAKSSSCSKGSSRRHRGMDVGRPSTLSQLVDVDLSKKDPRDEVMRLRELLKTVEKHAVSEARRAEELERANLEALHRVQVLSENRLLAEQEAEKANQEKRLYQLQLDNAQKEIERSQEAVKKTERERDEAEAAAERARAKARKLREQQMVLLAREEGRRLGYEAGLKHAEAELKMITAKKALKAKRAKKEVRRSEKEREREHRPEPREERREPREEHRRDQPSRREREDDRPEMSPSQLPLRNLPPMTMSMPSRPPSAQGPPPADRPFRFPEYPRIPQPMPQPIPAQPPPQPQRQAQRPPDPRAPPPLQTQGQPSAFPNPHSKQDIVAASPAMIRWELEVPSPEQLTHRSHGSWGRSSNEAIPQIPRDQWVSADQFQQMRPPAGPGLPPGGQPPQFILPPRPPPINTGIPTNITNHTPTKSVKFPLFSRPSLVKTKAASWYRSLSQRKKNKPVIDPIPEESVPQTANTMNTFTTTQPQTGSTMNYEESEPMTASEPPTAGTTNPQQPWNGAPGRQSTAPSVRTAQEYAYSRRGRPSSDTMSVSTKISQFDLLSTPYVAAQSVRSGKEGERRQVREKESYLSVIKEDPSSRGNTPSSDRHFAGSADGHGHMRNMPSFGSVAQPPFAPALQNRTSVATMNSSATNKRNSRRPPAIAVPEPDEELEPFGVAYDRHAQANGSSASLNSRGRHARTGADLSRRPSRISEKTTPDTSIVIDVVPPSGFAPDVVRSPPHTGRNHLSPYHTYQATPKATPRVAPAQSMASLRTQGGTKLQEPSALLGTPQRRPESRAESQKTPSEELKDAYMREHGSNYAPSPRVQRPPSSMSHAPSHISQAAHKSTRSLQLHTPRPEPTYTPRRHAAESLRPESVRSPAGFSTKNPSTTNLNNNNPYLASNTYRMSQVSLGSHINSQPPPAEPSSAPGPAPNQSTGGLVLQPPIRRERSNASLRSNGSFSRFIPDDYQDPAFWGPNGPGDAPAPSSNSVYGREQMAMRAGSANSGLSYTD